MATDDDARRSGPSRINSHAQPPSIVVEVNKTTGRPVPGEVVASCACGAVLGGGALVSPRESRRLHRDHRASGSCPLATTGAKPTTGCKTPIEKREPAKVERLLGLVKSGRSINEAARIVGMAQRTAARVVKRANGASPAE